MVTVTMLRTTAVIALVGSAAAFSPMMSMETGRRQIVQAGAAAATANPAAAMEKLNMSSNLERFSRYIAGDWTNYKQSNEFPALWSYIHVCYQPLPVNFLGTPSFYVESAYDYSLDKPYKTAIVSIKDTTNGIEMQNYKIKQPERFWLGAHQPSLLNNLERVDIIQLPSICDTMFEYNVDEKTYVGKTRPGKKCVIMRGEIQTYLDSRLIISHNSYSSWDIGREVKSNEQIWGATSGPFCFEKTNDNSL